MIKIEGKRKIRIIKMIGEPAYDGREGYAEFIDDIGQIHGTWGGLALQPDKDLFEVTVETTEDQPEE